MSVPGPLTLEEIRAELAEIRRVPGEAAERHLPIQVTFEDNGTPADVCWGCSDPQDRVWVPVSQCPVSDAAYKANGGPYGFPYLPSAHERAAQDG